MNSIKDCDATKTLQRHLLCIEPKQLASELGIDQSAVSRIRNGERGLKTDEIIKVLSMQSSAFARGLLITPAGAMTVSRDELIALRSLARKYLASEDAGGDA
ncbi:helix-turn-helix domain-containing protein [Rappaport israeli]|uniref:helix-turn-helix domain-containing protein n=1 Tax=Rappaport israeli TaxID=1839807 RepID=UPI00093054BC|nr:helix-turn-helix transcriptional regulator [Rappaport israeli]